MPFAIQNRINSSGKESPKNFVTYETYLSLCDLKYTTRLYKISVFSQHLRKIHSPNCCRIQVYCTVFYDLSNDVHHNKAQVS